MARAGRGFFDLLGFVARAAPVLVLLISIAAPAFTAPPGARIAHSSQSLAVPVHACQGSFVSHSLPHTTVISDERERIFAGMGAALGLGDLDNDADIDIVLGNLDAPATILWNEGQLAFRKQELAVGNARGVNTVDGDGWLDIVLTHPGHPASLWRNSATAAAVEFERAERFGAWHALNAMAWADLDRDGDLDIVVNNLNAPAKLFENRLCGGSSLQVDLIWPGSGNSRAIGSRLALHASTGSYLRETRSSSGYLSGDPNRTHFGFPAAAKLDRLEIVWPDGARSTVPMPMANSVLTVTRTP